MAAKKGMNWIWPKVIDLETAKLANRQGICAASFVAVVTAVLAALGAANIHLFEFTFDAWALIDACIFGVLAFGIYKMSRIASVAGLGLYLIERADMWITYGPKNLVIAAILVLMFINSVRGTFAYHRLREGKVEMGENQIKKEFTIHITAGDYTIEQISTHTYQVRNADERWPLTPTITLVPNIDDPTAEIHDKNAHEAMKAILEGVAKSNGKD